MFGSEARMLNEEYKKLGIQEEIRKGVAKNPNITPQETLVLYVLAKEEITIL